MKIKNFLKTRIGFLSLLVFLFWIKTLFAYFVDFKLGSYNPYLLFILVINPLATTVFLFGLSLYYNKRPTLSYWLAFILFLINTILLYANVIYYRQFTDFMTLNTILGSSKVASGLSASSLALAKGYDVIYFLDIISLAYLLGRHKITIDSRFFKPRQAFAITSLAFLGFIVNLTLSEVSRPQLLIRTFDRNYMVKYLGLDAFTVYDAVKTTKNNQVRAQANSYDINPILEYRDAHYAKPNADYFGVAKGKNVIVLHLESFQQFLIDFKVDGQEVTPFLNQLYHSQDTLGFENFFHQVGQGKTSDAENMLENSLFGLPQGSAFTTLGSDNTFQGAPAILNQTQNYTTAVFHGNNGSFWNRNNVYKNLGYQYFFDSSYYNTDPNNVLQYGLKDKIFFGESIKYLEQLQQPFYTKFITVTNHFPYPLPDEDSSFPTLDTNNSAVNNYFATAHYLDQSLKEFFDYLKATGVYQNSLFVLYGDHYGLSNVDNKALAPVLGKDSQDWTDFDSAQLQRVPYMLHMPGLKGGIQKQYGGEIDALPTLLHLLGINSKKYIQFGSDLLSQDHQQVVAFRNHNFVTPDYTVLGDDKYDNKTGELIPDTNTKALKKIKQQQQAVDETLDLSDQVNDKNLLRFYTPAGFKPVAPSDYDYLNGYINAYELNQKLGDSATSIYHQNNNQTTTSLFKTDAPEINIDKTADLDTIPADKRQRQATESESTLDNTN